MGAEVQVDRVGGLFVPRRTILLIDSRDRTGLIDGLERQIGHVRSVLTSAGYKDIEVRGALCFPNVDGLPLLRPLTLRDVVIDGPKPIAKLAVRQGPLAEELADSRLRELARTFPPA